MSTDATGTALAALDVLVGRWTSSGRTVARPGEPSIAITGTDTYEWLPGGHFLVHRVDVRVGEEQVDVLEVIGRDEDGTIAMRSFDHRGDSAVMHASVDAAGTWTFAGPAERAQLVVAEDGRSMSARWERRAGNGWEHWMDMEFHRTA
ncbi:DUF1579 family protein [Pseudonocardia nigra]|uniref:DUF1579 family protein n=1 Tax=Pseudonocardia nigra TaxID=1921578 RepID=UPI001C5E0477|nr:DUF1579 family protein [Pseudonocardia nigra]